MHTTFTTVVLNNSTNVSLDDMKMSTKVSVLCDTNHVPILDGGYPIVVQQVKEWNGKLTHSRLCLEDGLMILSNMKSVLACGIHAANNGISMQASHGLHLAAMEKAKAEAAVPKVEFAKETSLFDHMAILDEMGIKKYSFRNPEKLNDVLRAYLLDTTIKQYTRDLYYNKLKASGFSREVFCAAYIKYLSDQKMVSDVVNKPAIAELPVNIF